MKAILGVFAIVLVLGLTGCANKDLPADYVAPCASDGCFGENNY
jgi:outer membrane lipoprotein SlyB